MTLSLCSLLLISLHHARSGTFEVKKGAETAKCDGGWVEKIRSEGGLTWLDLWNLLWQISPISVSFLSFPRPNYPFGQTLSSCGQKEKKKRSVKQEDICHSCFHGVTVCLMKSWIIPRNKDQFIFIFFTLKASLSSDLCKNHGQQSVNEAEKRSREKKRFVFSFISVMTVRDILTPILCLWSIFQPRVSKLNQIL